MEIKKQIIFSCLSVALIVVGAIEIRKNQNLGKPTALKTITMVVGGMGALACFLMNIFLSRH